MHRKYMQKCNGTLVNGKKLEELNIKNIEVYSCGIYAQDGDTSTYEAKSVMEEYGVNLNKHRATNIRNSNIKQMDLILCATIMP